MRAKPITLITTAAVAAILSPMAAASGAPYNAPDRLEGTADCGADGTFSFVVNTGNSQATTFSPAFATTADGARAIFHPASFDLTFTTPFGTDTEVAAKRSGPGPVTCSITGSPASFPEATLSGTVTGSLTWLG